MNDNRLYSSYKKLNHSKILKYVHYYLNTNNNIKKDEHTNTTVSTPKTQSKKKLNEVRLNNKINSFLSNKIKSKSQHNSKLTPNKEQIVQPIRKLSNQTPSTFSYSCKNAKMYKTTNNYSHRKLNTSPLTNKNDGNFVFLKENYILLKPFCKFDEKLKQKIRKELFKKKNFIIKKNLIDENIKEVRNIDAYSLTNRKENKSKKLFESLIYKKEIEVNLRNGNKKNISRIKMGSEGILTDIILKKRKVINCINPRLCFPYLMNDGNLMNNFSKPRNILAKDNFI